MDKAYASNTTWEDFVLQNPHLTRRVKLYMKMYNETCWPHIQMTNRISSDTSFDIVDGNTIEEQLENVLHQLVREFIVSTLSK